MKVGRRTWTNAKGEKCSALYMDYEHPVTRIRRRETITGVTDIKLARRIAAKFYEDLCARAALGDASSELERTITLKDLLVNDLKRVPLAEGTRKLEEYAHANLLRILGESVLAVRVSYAQLLGYQAERQKDVVRGVHPTNKTINRELATLRAAYNRAFDSSIISTTPRFPKPLPITKKPKRYLEPWQLEKFFVELYQMYPETGVHMEVMYHLGGLRPCELWNMTWRDVDFDQGTVRIKSTKRGTGDIRTRVLPMSDRVRSILLARKAADGKKIGDYIFGKLPHERQQRLSRKSGKAGHKDGVLFLGDYRFSEKVKKAAAAAGIHNPEEIVPYVMRHSTASNVQVDTKEASEMLGHADVRTTMEYYRHLRKKDLFDAVKSLAEHTGQRDDDDFDCAVVDITG